MFDFGQIIEKISGLFENADVARDLVSGNLPDVLNAAQIDPSMLESLPVEQIDQLLEQAGIDPSSIAPSDLPTVVQELLQSSGFEGLGGDRTS